MVRARSLGHGALGLTLPEAVLVVALVVTLFLLLLPLARRHWHDSQVLAMTDRGRMLFTTMHGSPFEEYSMAELRSQYKLVDTTSHSQWKTSTEYFRSVVESQLVTVGYGFFSGPGVPKADSDGPASFSSSNNAWCVTANLNRELLGTFEYDVPVYFSRNLTIENLGERLRLSEQSPFGERIAVGIRASGSGLTIRTSDAGTYISRTYTNTVLRP